MNKRTALGCSTAMATCLALCFWATRVVLTMAGAELPRPDYLGLLAFAVYTMGTIFHVFPLPPRESFLLRTINRFAPMPSEKLEEKVR